MSATYCYRNLRYGGWSLGDAPKSRATNPRHRTVLLADVRFHVNAASQRWMVKRLTERGTRDKLVHAFAYGELQAVDGAAPQGARTPIAYHPYECGKFIRRDSGAPLAWCEAVFFGPEGECFAIGRVEEE